jgi:peptidoglycan/xylan/chitin deacetylase (PgdA/CDA1 family)
MNIRKKLYYNLCAALPLSALKSFASVGTLLPYHHTVSDEALPHIQHLYKYKNTKQFIKDVDYFLKNYKPISVTDLIDHTDKNKTLHKNSFLLTFDDGFKEIHEIIAPILEKKGVPAIFFINPAYVDNKALAISCKKSLLINELINKKTTIEIFGNALNFKQPTVQKIIFSFKTNKLLQDIVFNNIANEIGFSFADFASNAKPYATTSQLNDLNKRGFNIGAHSWNHPYYDTIMLEEQLEETTSSCKFIKDNFTNKELCFSFPYSDTKISQLFFEKINNEPIDLFFGIQNQREEWNNKMLHRFNGERPDVSTPNLIKGILLYIGLKKRFGKYTVERM